MGRRRADAFVVRVDVVHEPALEPQDLAGAAGHGVERRDRDQAGLHLVGGDCGVLQFRKLLPETVHRRDHVGLICDDAAHAGGLRRTGHAGRRRRRQGERKKRERDDKRGHCPLLKAGVPQKLRQIWRKVKV